MYPREASMLSSVMLDDLDFQKIPVQCFSTQGTPYLRWARTGMPKVNQQVIESVFYLYRNRQDAERGEDARGTGFVVLFEGSLYAVTNRHVVAGCDAAVVRVNASNGVDIFDFGPEDWESVAGGP